MQAFKSSKLPFLKTIPGVAALACARLAGLLRALFSKKTLDWLVAELFNPNQTDEVKSLSVAFGIFMGILPIWGFQTIVAILLALPLKLSKSLVLIGTQISCPPLFPFVVLLSFKMGKYFTGDADIGNAKGMQNPFQLISSHFLQYLYGSITLAVVTTLIAGLFTYLFLKTNRVIKQQSLLIFRKKL